MNKLEQLEKDHKAMGKTIKKMKAEVAKPVWCRQDITRSDGRPVAISEGGGKFLVVYIGRTEGTGPLGFRLIADRDLMSSTLQSFMQEDEMVDYLNKNNYTKA